MACIHTIYVYILAYLWYNTVYIQKDYKIGNIRIATQSQNRLQELSECTGVFMAAMLKELISDGYVSRAMHPKYKRLDEQHTLLYKVYKITFESGKVYIGMTKTLHTRMQQHTNRFSATDLIKDVEVLLNTDDVMEASAFELLTISKHITETTYNKEGAIPYYTQYVQQKAEPAHSEIFLELQDIHNQQQLRKTKQKQMHKLTKKVTNESTNIS